MNNINDIAAKPTMVPTIASVQVANNNRPYAELRSREYLTPDEVTALMKEAGSVGRHRHRDATMILLAYRHGLRCSELTGLRWSQLDYTTGTLHVIRLKGSRDSVHPVRGTELRALRRLQREAKQASPYVFTGERKGPLTGSTVRRMITRAGVRAELSFPVHTHMLRHACGFYLANQGQDTRAIQQYLGHTSISNTIRYTELAACRFDNFWSD